MPTARALLAYKTMPSSTKGSTAASSRPKRSRKVRVPFSPQQDDENTLPALQPKRTCRVTVPCSQQGSEGSGGAVVSEPSGDGDLSEKLPYGVFAQVALPSKNGRQGSPKLLQFMGKPLFKEATEKRPKWSSIKPLVEDFLERDQLLLSPFDTGWCFGRKKSIKAGAACRSNGMRAICSSKQWKVFLKETRYKEGRAAEETDPGSSSESDDDGDDAGHNGEASFVHEGKFWRVDICVTAEEMREPSSEELRGSGVSSRRNSSGSGMAEDSNESPLMAMDAATSEAPKKRRAGRKRVRRPFPTHCLVGIMGVIERDRKKVLLLLPRQRSLSVTSLTLWSRGQ